MATRLELWPDLLLLSIFPFMSARCHNHRTPPLCVVRGKRIGQAGYLDPLITRQRLATKTQQKIAKNQCKNRQRSPSKFMDYILNVQKYFYVTYVMANMPTTYFHSPKRFVCNAVGTRKGRKKGDLPRKEDRRPFA